MLNQVVELKREVTAVQIPSGDVLTLPEGERVYITQILGGTYTVATDYGLARISREDAGRAGRRTRGKFPGNGRTGRERHA